MTRLSLIRRKKRNDHCTHVPDDVSAFENVNTIYVYTFIRLYVHMRICMSNKTFTKARVGASVVIDTVLESMNDFAVLCRNVSWYHLVW